MEERNYVSPSVPKTYSKSTLAKLKVNASNHSLSGLSPYYYEFGMHLSYMMGDQEMVQVTFRAASVP